MVIEAIQKFLLNLPGRYKITRKDTNVVSISVDKKLRMGVRNQCVRYVPIS